MSDFPDFTIQAGSQDVEDDVLNDLLEWWMEKGDEQKSDYLSAWDSLQYGDTTYIDGYPCRCLKSYTSEEPYVGFIIIIH